MNVSTYETWSDLKSLFERYASLDLERREQFIFRGLPTNEWRLETTLDRYSRQHNFFDRDRVKQALMRDFKRGCHGLVSLHVESPEEWGLLARHHGLPSPYLDWTQSPYVATFFALADPRALDSETVSIWALDREVFSLHPISEIELIDDYDALKFNARAIEQRGVFLEVKDVQRPIEEILASHLYRFDLPRSVGRQVLADLDSMTINDRTLFRDLEGVARTTAARVSHLGETNE